MSAELNLNVMFSQRGHLTLAHSDAALRTMRWRAEVNVLEGVDSRVIDAGEVKALVPSLDVSPRTAHPILGALYHPPGGIIRHDAVVWGYGRAAAALGVELHQETEVSDILVAGGDGPDGKGPGGRVTGVRTSRGDINAPVVVNCAAGWASIVAAMAGVALPITTTPLQAAVTEPVKVFLSAVVVSGSLHVYVSQTDRGELVFGAAVDPVATYSTRGSLEFVEGLAGNILQLMPGIARVRLLRQWAGLCDMTPDYSPVMGRTPVDGFFVDVGWGTYGFKAGPVSGEQLAACIATGRAPALIAAFDLARFTEDRLVGEKGAAAVGTDAAGRLPSLRPPGRRGLSLLGRDQPAARPRGHHRPGVANLPAPACQRGRLAAGDLVLPSLPPARRAGAQHTLTNEFREPVVDPRGAVE